MPHSLGHSENDKERRYHGIPASRGIVFGKAIVIHNDLISDYEEHIEISQIPHELEHFEIGRAHV